MITSMTGYAAATRELPTASLAAEVKSVNGRFLDVQFRLSEELRTVEPALRELIQARVARGRAWPAARWSAGFQSRRQRALHRGSA